MLARPYRLKQRRDIQRLYRARRTAQTAALSVKLAPNRLDHSRGAVVVSTKISKQAVKRNLLRRRLLAALARLWPRIGPSQDLLVIVRPGALDQSVPALQVQLQQCLQAVGALRQDRV